MSVRDDGRNRSCPNRPIARAITISVVSDRIFKRPRIRRFETVNSLCTTRANGSRFGRITLGRLNRKRVGHESSIFMSIFHTPSNTSKPKIYNTWFSMSASRVHGYSFSPWKFTWRANSVITLKGTYETREFRDLRSQWSNMDRIYIGTNRS